MQEPSLKEVNQAIDERIRPKLALHGGDVRIVELIGGTLKVRMLGRCSGCPSASLTAELLIESELKEIFPNLKQVILVSGVSDSLLAEASKLLAENSVS